MSKIKHPLSSVICLLFIIATGCTPFSKHDTSTVYATQNTKLSPILTNSSISGWIVYSNLVSREPFKTQIFIKKLDTNDIHQLTYSGNNSFPK